VCFSALGGVDTILRKLCQRVIFLNYFIFYFTIFNHTFKDDFGDLNSENSTPHLSVYQNRVEGFPLARVFSEDECPTKTHLAEATEHQLRKYRI